MKTVGYFGLFLKLTLDRLCQQRWLLAGLVLLCALLPLGAGRAAGQLFSQGVDFAGVTLAVTAPEGDETPRLLEGYMGEMEDIAQYCQFRGMAEADALEALRAGEVTAVLALPENFIQGVMDGGNPDLRLIVDGERPLESLLLLWVGQSACDILSALQSGVYAVLDLYAQSPPPGLSRDQVVVDINLRYIRLALDRGELFQSRTVSATGVLPVHLHYALALLAYLGLSAAPLFLPLYSGSWMGFQRRLRAAGRGPLAGCLSGVTAGAAALFLLLAPALLLLGEGPPLPLLGAALGMAVFCSIFCALCCLAWGSAAGCGGLSFAVSLASLALAGGVVPPVLLPGALRRLTGLSPVTWLARLAAGPMGYETPLSVWIALGLTGIGMALLSLRLYRRRMDREVRV